VLPLFHRQHLVWATVPLVAVAVVLPRTAAAADRVRRCDGDEWEHYKAAAVAAAVVVAAAAGIVGVGRAAAGEDGGMLVAGDTGRDRVVEAHLDGVLRHYQSGGGKVHCLRLDEEDLDYVRDEIVVVHIGIAGCDHTDDGLETAEKRQDANADADSSNAVV
jgi:hypothetical protein